MGKYESNMYASDLDKDKRNDGFMGKGFTEAYRKAQEHGNELIIGKFCPNGQWEEN